MSDPTPAEALKACPLCGEKPERNGRHGRGGVVCRRTGHLFQVYGSDQRDAEERWNTQPPAADAGEVRTEAREVLARVDAFIEHYEDAPNWGGPTIWPKPLTIADIKALRELAFPSPPQPLGDR